MPYLDDDILYNNVEEKYKSAKGEARAAYSDVLDTICEMPRADVVPKSEVERWRRQLEAVLEEIPETKRELAGEIFEEIDNWFELYSEREYSFAEEEASKGHLPESEAHDYALDIIKDLRQLCVAELKKKYTEKLK